MIISPSKIYMPILSTQTQIIDAVIEYFILLNDPLVLLGIRYSS